jgi:hypothetical protein
MYGLVGTASPSLADSNSECFTHIVKVMDVQCYFPIHYGLHVVLLAKPISEIV